MKQLNGYFALSDLAKELDVKKNHIRFCEKNGLIPPRIFKLKRRLYNRYDRERLKFIFHFVLLGYSKEQIIDLIGIPDGNLNENDQLIQGIEYGLNQIKNLEKRKEELGITKQIRTVNEIEMLREYVKKIKIIESGPTEEPTTETDDRFKRKERIHHGPLTAIDERTDKNTTQHPVKVMSLFVAGLALVIFIGSYFYFKAGQKVSVPSEKTRVLQAPVPMDQGEINEATKDNVEHKTETEELKEEAAPDLAGKEMLLTTKPDSEKEKVTETEVTFPLNLPKKEIKKLSSEEVLGQQQNELRRLKDFLDQYCKAYSNKDVDKWITFFASDATENNKPFHELLPDYRTKMEAMEYLTYRIELTSFSKQTASENIMVRGKFFTRYQGEKGDWEENNGRIFMELISNKDSFLIKQLNYSSFAP